MKYRFKIELKTASILLDTYVDVIAHEKGQTAKEAETFLRLFLSESAKRGGQLKVKLVDKGANGKVKDS